MNDSVVIEYNGEQVSVPKEVADFLKQDRKREQAQKSRTKLLKPWAASWHKSCNRKISVKIPERKDIFLSGTF